MELNNNQGRTRTRNNHQEGEEEPLDTAYFSKLYFKTIGFA